MKRERKEVKLESEYMGKEENVKEQTQKRGGKWERYGWSNEEREREGVSISGRY